LITEFGGPEVLHLLSRPRPLPTESEVLVEVMACGVNPHDVWVRSGRRGGVPLPLVPGVEPVGIVRQVGAAVSQWQPGDRVCVTPFVPCGDCFACSAGNATACPRGQMIGQHRDGGYGEFVTLPERGLVRIPDIVPWVEAAALPVAYGTAFRALFTRAGLQAAQTVVVSGAAGGLGVAAVALAAMAGAHVIATTNRPCESALLALGANRVVTRSVAAVGAAVGEATAGRGADVVFDHAGGWAEALELIRPGGVLVNCGAGALQPATVDPRALYPAERSIVGSIVATRSELEQVMQLAKLGRLAPVIAQTYRLDEIVEAHRRLAGGSYFGKLVVVPGESSLDTRT
jgi:NADPH:quinone reductase-like Zn-dependent oxidoreductase